MHELSIAISILDFAEEEAESRGVAIEAIHVRLGALSGIVKEALVSAFELAREGTAFDACRLVINETPATIYCAGCQQEKVIDSVLSLRCPDCDTPADKLRQGRELQVVGLELAE